MRFVVPGLLVVLVACGRSREDRGGEPARPSASEPVAATRTRRPPMEVIVGRDPKRLGFETTPVLGATPEALKAAYGAALVRSSDFGGTLTFVDALDIPGVPAKARDLHVDLFYLNGVVSELEIMTRIELEAQLIDALTAVRGTPTGSLDAGGLVFPSSPPLVLTREGGTVTTPYLKLAVRATR